MLESPWYITLCGRLTAHQGTHVVSRFRTQKTGLLLAYLALHPERIHGREELAERFWEDSDTPLQSLRTALTTLRQQLEPPGVGRGEVLKASRTHVGLAPGAVYSDVALFRKTVAEAESVSEVVAQITLLRRGVDAISGELLPGSYLEWVQPERDLLSEQMREALSRLVRLLTAQAEPEQALLYALRLVHLSPLEEEAHVVVMRLLIALKRPADVLQQFERLTFLLREELGTAPASYVQALMNSVASSPMPVVIPTSTDAAILSASHTKFPILPDKDTAAPSVLSSNPAFLPLPTSRLPLLLTPFLGREKEFALLLSLLIPPSSGDENYGFQPTPRHRTPRLLTILGTGGSGKTRLAIEVAQAYTAEHSRNTCFVSLVDADTPDRMTQLIAEAVCPTAPPGSVPQAVIIAALTERSFLLVLDNMEQVAESGAEIVRDLLEQLPNLNILVTSRQRLNLDGEREFVLLPLPTPERVDTPECLLEFASVQLFVDRAQAARSDFQLTPRNAASVAALCRRLEGLPLALELAASWSQTLSPAQMLTRMERRFDLLRARRKGVSARHQALETCIAWSFRLLGAEVQAFFCRVCLLRGEWTLRTAEIIAGENSALDSLQRLREASFLLGREVIEAEGTVLRFHMLDSLREFGLERLTPGETDDVYERLVQSLIALPYENLMATIDYENIRGAVLWCRRSPAGYDLELSLLNALTHFWWQKGFCAEGCRWMQDALAQHTQEISIAHRKAWNTLGFLYATLGDNALARRSFERSVADSERAEDALTAVRALSNLAVIAVKDGDSLYGCELMEHSLRLAEPLGDSHLVIMLTINVGGARLELGQDEMARTYFEQGLQQSREKHIPGGIALSLSGLAEVAQRAGDSLAARQMFEECLEIFRVLREQPRIADTLAHLVAILREQGDFVQARVFEAEMLLVRQLLKGEE